MPKSLYVMMATCCAAAMLFLGIIGGRTIESMWTRGDHYTAAGFSLVALFAVIVIVLFGASLIRDWRKEPQNQPWW
jgi:hypothetical protein